MSLVAGCEVTQAGCIGTCVLKWRGMFPEGGFAGQPFIEAWASGVDRHVRVVADGRVKEEFVYADHGS